jgi:archaellum biogenesis ATPase FlaH
MSIAPENMTKLSHVISEFLKKNKNSVILLDSLEYLINNNDFPRVLKFIQLINEMVVINNAILIVPLNPSIIVGREKEILEKELGNTIGRVT